MTNTFSQKYKLYTGKKLNWLQLILLLGNSVVADILPWIVFFASYSFVLTAIYYLLKMPVSIPQNDAISTLLLVFNLGLPSLLIFRTNTANERFWEARKLWGDLVNVVRNLTRDISIVVQGKSSKSKKEKEKVLLLVVAFGITMKLHLRSEQVNDEIIPLISTNQFYELKYNSDHPPLQIAYWIGDYLQLESDRNCIHIYQLVALHNLVDSLVNILGGCERILKTPQPIIYTLVLRKLIVVYCLLLPLEIIQDLRGFTIIITTFVSMILFGIEQIGSQLEHPFAHHPNALPLDLICNTILLNVQELIEQTNQNQTELPYQENRHNPKLGVPSKHPRRQINKRQKKQKQITLKDLIALSDNDYFY
ncbi:MAG: bestrophin family protein [Waterburya sp.]